MFLCDGYPRRQQPQLFSESNSISQLYLATEWIITGSRLGQQVLEWLLERSGVFSFSVAELVGLDNTLLLWLPGFWGWSSVCRAVLGGRTSLPVGSWSTFKSGWQGWHALRLSGYPRTSFFFSLLNLLELLHQEAYQGFNCIRLCKRRKENTLVKSGTLGCANSAWHVTSGMTVSCAPES